MKKSFGFGVVVECSEGIDEVDLRRILEEAFRDPTWKDVSKFDVVSVGTLDEFPEELSGK